MVLRVDTGLSSLEIQQQDTEIHLYDLKYCGNRPSERLVFQKSEASHGRYDGGRRPGLSSLRFKDGSGNVVIAGSEAGDILAFDRRTKQSINTILSPAENVGGFNCIAIHPGMNFFLFFHMEQDIFVPCMNIKSSFAIHRLTLFICKPHKLITTVTQMAIV